MKHLFTFTFIIGFSIASYAQDLKVVGEAYIKAYFDKNETEFVKYLHPDVTWSDPTWSEVDPNNKPVSGKDAVISHLRNATAGIEDLKYEIDNQFFSGNHAIFEGTMSYSFVNAQNGKSLKFKIREVSVLEIKDGLVIKHTDYSDFKTWLTQYKEQG